MHPKASKIRFLLLLVAMTLVVLASHPRESLALPCCSGCDACLDCCDLGLACCHPTTCHNICAHCNPDC
ncbi:MAG TPA: hypothetical protein VLV54_03205 [Thermoanaerobaculia bacterium]|nr:hypothetical protein [Thermoanaerobaculia bacterium]